MKKFWLIAVGILMMALHVSAQTGAVPGYCNNGAKHALTSGQSSSNFQQQVIPYCTVTVFLTGTTTKATIFKDSVSTPQTNPFQANADSSWLFWAATNAGLDVMMSGGYAPNAYTTPVTIPDVFPSQSFAPVSGVISINTVQGSFTFTGPDVSCVSTTCTFSNSSGAVLQTNGSNNTSQALLNFVNTPTVQFTNPSGGVEEANVIVTNGFTQFLTPPIGGQYVFVPATTHNIIQNDGTVTLSNTSGTLTLPVGGAGIIEDNVSWSGYTLPSYVLAANVTAVYAVAVSSQTNFDLPNFGSPGSALDAFMTCASQSVTGVNVNGWGIQQATALTSLTGTTLSSATCTAQIYANFSGGGNLQIPLVGYLVYYTGSAPPANTNVIVQAPLTYNPDTQTLGISLPNDTVLDTGAANAYVVTMPTYNFQPGLTIKMLVAHQSTSTTPTLAFNGSYAYTIQGITGTSLQSGDLKTTIPAILLWNGSNWLLQNPQVSAGGGTTTNALTAAASGGAGPGATFNGGSAVTFDYHTLGAAGLAASNAFTGATTNDFSGTSQFKLPVAAGYASLANGELGYDSTNKNFHGWVNGADSLLIPIASGFVSGHCGQPTSSGGSWSIVDTGFACGNGSGGITGSGTIGYYALFTGTTAIGNGHLDDGVTLTSWITSTLPFQVSASSLPSQITLPYNAGHAPSGTAGAGAIAPDSSGNMQSSDNGGSYARICNATNGVCSTGTTTNALTAAASGGAGPGSTFNGGTAVTFDYHSFGAQQALTLTTTGTSGAATLLSGTLNIPQYSGGTTTNALTMNNSGSGAASGATFNGGTAVTLSYNTLGAAPLASPTFTGVPAAPTASGGTSTTQLATTAFVQAAIAAAGTGAGIVTYSGPALSLTGTQYLPIGGGGLASSTETNVDIDSPAAVTVQNLTVQMSAAPGVGNSVTYTWRKNASSTVLTCTISGASATSCSDTTHNFTTVALDLLDIQTVTSGTIVGTPTVVMAAQIGVSAVATVSSFSGDGALLNNSLSTGAVTATLANAGAHKVWANNTGSSTLPGYQTLGSQDVSPAEYIAGGGTANAQTATLSPAATSLATGLEVKWKPSNANSGAATLAVNGLTATAITKCGTTALASNDLTTTAVAIATYDGPQFQLVNPQSASCGSGGGGVTPAPPYWTSSGTFYDERGFTVTKPPSTASWVNSVAATNWNAQTNGDVVVSGVTGATNYFQTQSLSTSIDYEGVATSLLNTGNNSQGTVHGIWVYDSTNGFIYTWSVIDLGNVSGGVAPPTYLQELRFVYTGSGNPNTQTTRNTSIAGGEGFAFPAHLRIIKSGSTLNFQNTLNGGASYNTIWSESGIGTISSGGVFLVTSTTNTVILDVYSLAVN